DRQRGQDAEAVVVPLHPSHWRRAAVWAYEGRPSALSPRTPEGDVPPMSYLTRTATAIGVALLAAALPAAAGAAQAPFVHSPVPAGQLQHTVTDISFPAATNTRLPHVADAAGIFPGDTVRTETWMGATEGRSIRTDLMTGKIVSDCGFTTTVVRCFESGNSDKDGHNIA